MSEFEKQNKDTTVCRVCGPDVEVRLVNIPYVLRYLVAELAAMNIKLEFKTDNAPYY